MARRELPSNAPLYLMLSRVPIYDSTLTNQKPTAQDVATTLVVAHVRLRRYGKWSFHQLANA